MKARITALITLFALGLGSLSAQSSYDNYFDGDQLNTDYNYGEVYNSDGSASASSSSSYSTYSGEVYTTTFSTGSGNYNSSMHSGSGYSGYGYDGTVYNGGPNYGSGNSNTYHYGYDGYVYNPSNLNIRSDDNSFIIVKLDGKQSAQAAKSHRFTNVSPGSHHVQIWKLSGKQYGPHGWTNTKTLVYNGNINVGQGQDIYAVMCPYDGFYIENTSALYPNNYDDIGWCGTHPTTVHDDYDYHPYQGNNPYGNNIYYVAMNSSQFATYKQSVSNQSWDDTRLLVAKQGIQQNYLTANQVAQIMTILRFEDTRLQFAKYAYDRTIDKQNYYQVYDEFTFSSSIDELSDYLAMK